MRQIAQGIVRDNVLGGVVPFSFALSTGNIELKGAQHKFMLNIIQKITQLLKDNNM